MQTIILPLATFVSMVLVMFLSQLAYSYLFEKKETETTSNSAISATVLGCIFLVCCGISTAFAICGSLLFISEF
jgi:hypothetical protein